MEPAAPSNGSSPGTVSDSSVVTNAIASAVAGPQPSLGDAGDAAYDKAVPPTAPELPKPAEPEVPETSPQTPSAEGQEPEGYFADEGIDDDRPSTPSPASAPANPQNFSGEEKYIADNIGAPLNVRIKVGDEVRTVQAYSVENLPENFEFASDRDRTQAQLGFDAIIRKAEKLQGDFANQQQQNQANQFEERENRDIQRDIGALQRLKDAGKDGLDKFKYAPNDPRFDSDPAVKEMQDVLDFYNKENQARFNSSQRNGTLYHRLSYADAFRLYRTENPKVGPAQEKEDKERKEITRPLAKANRSQGEAPKQTKPKLPWNADVDQIARAYGLN